MIGYALLGTNDLQRASGFYDSLLAELGGTRAMEFPTTVIYGAAPGQPMLGVTKPYDGNAATVGNGVMISLAADKPATVDRVYKKAMSLGAKDEGPAGPRNEKFYAGYFRDLDGNKLCVYCLT